MSRFIPEGKSDLKSLQKSENEAANKFATEKEEEEIPSLYEQMKANYIAKEKEYEDKVKAKNQSHKIDERELEFYNSLQRTKEAKELERKRQLEEQLEIFEQKKRATKPLASAEVKDTKSSIPDFDIPAKPIKLTQKAKKRQPSKQEATKTQTKDEQTEEAQKPTNTNILAGYSSSESDSE